MNIQPIGERVLLKPSKTEEKTSGGIYIPETAKEEKKEGEVVAVGTTKDGNQLPLSPGDKVLYGGYNSDDFEKDGEKYLIIEFKDILAKLGWSKWVNK